MGGGFRAVGVEEEVLRGAEVKTADVGSVGEKGRVCKRMPEMCTSGAR